MREIIRDREKLRVRREALREPCGTAASRPARWHLLAGLAALLAVAAGLALLHRQESSPAPLWLPVSGERVEQRGTGGPLEEGVFREALAAYRRRDTERVRELLEGRVRPRRDLLPALMLAHAELLDGNGAQCLRLLEEVQIELLPAVARPHARWFLYRCLREQGRVEEAERVLTRLANEPGVVGQRAREESAMRGLNESSSR